MIFPGIRNPSCQSKEESLHRDDINGVDLKVAINIRGIESAPNKWSAKDKKVTLDSNDIHRVDPS